MINFKELRTQLNEKYKSKFPSSLVSAAVKIALDMGGNMTGAYKKIEKMKRGLGDDPAVKNALQLANEDFSSFAEEKEIPFGYTFFDMSDVRKFTGLIKGLKGLEILSTEKMKGGQYVIRVKGPRKVVAKANSLAIRTMSDDVNEGTMAIGIKSRDRKEVEKAKLQLSKMLKKDGNKNVGSKEGQKFDEVLDTYILSDDELADEFANPKNKNMKVKDLLNKHAKRLNVKFESVEEAKGDFPSSMTYFDKKGATKAEKIAKGLKIYKNTKEVGKAPNFAYTVHVMGSFDKIEKWIDLI